MSNYTTSADLIDAILDDAGELTDGTSDFNSMALRQLNRAYQAICMGGSEIDPQINEDWLWLRKDPPGVLTLKPVIETGTVSVTNNNTAVTFSSAPTDSVAGYFLQTDGGGDIFRISAHTASSTSATLDAVYTQITDASAAYTLFKLEYDLATDVLRLLSPMRVYNTRDYIDGMTLPALEREWPLRLVATGVPRAFAQLTETKVRFSHGGGTSSTDLIRVEYDYLRRPDDLADDSAEPVVPRQFRKTLADLALYFLFIAKNDSRADTFGLLAKNGLRAMAHENRKRMAVMRSNGHIFPRAGDTPASLEILRTNSGLIIG